MGGGRSSRWPRAPANRSWARCSLIFLKRCDQVVDEGTRRTASRLCHWQEESVTGKRSAAPISRSSRAMRWSGKRSTAEYLAPGRLPKSFLMGDADEESKRKETVIHSGNGYLNSISMHYRIQLQKFILFCGVSRMVTLPHIAPRRPA
jgi:hypothetical protein